MFLRGEEVRGGKKQSHASPSDRGRCRRGVASQSHPPRGR